MVRGTFVNLELLYQTKLKCCLILILHLEHFKMYVYFFKKSLRSVGRVDGILYDT